MGGFEGGDEGGFWDAVLPPLGVGKAHKTFQKLSIEESDAGCSIKAHAKVSIF